MERDEELFLALVQEAKEARKMAYAPYSNFAVGAALLCEDGTVYKGCNVENAAFSPTNCAERTAVFKAVSEGKRKFRAIAIVGGKIGEELTDWCAPCGVCRQVLNEFVDQEEFLVILGKEGKEYKKYVLQELLPMGMKPEVLM